VAWSGNHVTAYSAAGIDGISAAFRRWLRSRPPRQQWADRPRPVVLNTWEAVYFDHNLDTLRRLADTAAQLGVERLVPDDGWFRDRRDDAAGLGGCSTNSGLGMPTLLHLTNAD
jgi:alpha-galactosidase